MNKNNEDLKPKNSRFNNETKEGLTARELEMHEFAVNLTAEIDEKVKAFEKTLKGKNLETDDRVEGIAVVAVVQPFVTTKTTQKCFGAILCKQHGYNTAKMVEEPLAEYFLASPENLMTLDNVNEKVGKYTHETAMEATHEILGDLLEKMRKGRM